ncbi:MAG: response regulator [Nitrospirota bacterium]
MTESAPDRCDTRNRFLLVVDSDITTLSQTSRILERFHYQVFKAASAEEALQMATVALPAVIITCLALKGMNGLELIEELKQYSATAPIPVIALSRQDDFFVKKRCLELGAVDCLKFPVLPEELYRVIQSSAEKTPRKSMRIQTVLPIKIHTPEERAEEQMTLELSASGLFLPLPSHSQIKTNLALDLALPGRRVSAEARVIYVCDSNEGPCRKPGVGLEFTRISSEDKELVHRFIVHEITEEMDYSHS